ncbi:MAG: hypothetical protein ACR2N3_08880 [Pyrinomonadaceae bacterium]
MNYFKFRPLIALLTFVVGVSLVWICLLPKRTQEIKQMPGESISISEDKSLEQLLAPKGDEIRIEVKYLKPKKAIVTVYNDSSGDVFMPYLPGIKSKWAYFSCLQEEKLNSKTGEFETLQGSDFGCGMHSLPAGKSFKYVMWMAESGSYRVNVNYSIDTRLHEQIEKFLVKNQGHFNEEEAKEIDNKIRLFTKVIVSKTVKL